MNGRTAVQPYSSCGLPVSIIKISRYLNFFENPDYASVFVGSLEVDNLTGQILILPLYMAFLLRAF